MLRTDLEQWIGTGNLRRAASSLVVEYGSDVYATCAAMLRDRVAAEDLTQDVFGDAIRGLASYRGEAAPRTWLLSIARNRCIDYLRARKRDPWGGALDDAAPDPDEHPDTGAFGTEWFADRSVVLRALDALAEGDRALVVLRFKNGLDYDELANAFGLREGTVRMRVSRALARMRQVLEADTPAAAPSFGAPAPPPRAVPGGGAPPPAAAAAPLMRSRAATGALAPAAPSWWSRLVAWARGDEPPPPAPHAPLGALGITLAAGEPTTPSEALAGRLGALVDTLPER